MGDSPSSFSSTSCFSPVVVRSSTLSAVSACVKSSKARLRIAAFVVSSSSVKVSRSSSSGRGSVTLYRVPWGRASSSPPFAAFSAANLGPYVAVRHFRNDCLRELAKSQAVGARAGPR